MVARFIIAALLLVAGSGVDAKPKHLRSVDFGMRCFGMRCLEDGFGFYFNLHVYTYWSNPS